MPRTEGGDHHAADIERDAGAVIPRRASLRIAQHLAHSQTCRPNRTAMASATRAIPHGQQGDDDDLRQRHDQARNPRRALGTKSNRQGLDAGLDVALDCLEIVECHDAMRADRIEQRQDDHRPSAARQRTGPQHR